MFVSLLQITSDNRYYVKLYVSATENDFTLMDAQPHRTTIVVTYIKDKGIEPINWSTRFQILKIKYLWDCFRK